jgi:hypothetical protein
VKKRRRDIDAERQWQQLELLIPGVAGLPDAKSMDGKIYPDKKKPSTAQVLIRTEAETLTLKGMHVTEPKRRDA